MYYVDNFEQIDKEVMDIFRNRSFRDFTGEVKDIEVIYAQPDLDVRDDISFPVIAVQRTTPYLDRFRMGDDKTKITFDEEYDEEGNLLAYRELPPPIPMIVEYTISVKYDKESDGAIIISDLMRDLIYGGFITINGERYPFDVSFSGITGTQYKDFGKLSGGVRTFEERINLVLKFWMNPPMERDEDGNIISEKVTTIKTIKHSVGIIDGKKRKEDYYG